MTSLTASGCGRLLDIHADATPEVVTEQLISAAQGSGVALARGLALTREQFRDIATKAGSLAEHRFGTGSADLLDLNADPDPDKVITGRAALPLHADGALVGTRPGIILLYANEYEELAGFGATIICDQYAALADLPDDLRRDALSTPWEYWVEDESHFPTIAKRWVSVEPVVVEADGRNALNVAMPFPDSSVKPGWLVRLPGLTEAESDRRLAALDAFLRTPANSYRHAWQPGDLLAINNRAVLHGREAISATGRRHLFRAQLQ